MTDVALDRADPAPAGAVGGGVEGVRQRLYLDGVADAGTRPVRLDVPDVGRIDTGHPLGEQDRVALAGYRRRGEADLVGTVVVDRRAADHRGDAVPVAQRVGQPLQHDDPDPVARYRARRVLVERPAVPVR